MANTKAPRGFINPRLITGGTPNLVTRRVSSAYASDFYVGQPYKMLSTGFVVHCAATNATTILGICHSFLPNPVGQVIPTGFTRQTEIQGFEDLRNTLFEVQLSGTGTQAVIGENCAVPGAGWMTRVDATRKMSTILVWRRGATNAPYRIRGFVQDAYNEPNSDNPRVLVQVNPAHTFQNQLTAV